jgi:3-hydroxyphenylacetate 6-hydroxylase
MLSGGLDTVTTLVAWSIGLLSARPDVQDKAVKAIRELYGTNEPMCSADDDQKCTYVTALVRECLRYFTVLRLALPRTSIRDITYQGTVIPKGTVFFLNAWACNMDPDVWTDPEEFRPERWLEQPDAPMFTYGLGYRMCAGSLLANRELYLVFMRTLNSFRIEPHDDIDWHPVRGNSDPASLVAIPQKYKVRFVPRDAKALNKVLATP